MPAKIKSKYFLMVPALVLLLSGLYMLLLTFSPQLPFISSPFSISFSGTGLPDTSPQEDALYIEKLGLKVPFAAGNKSVLEKGAWHRFPERGDPVQGGNFILSAHRFYLGLTPQATKQRSPFYHLDKLVVGDTLTVDFRGQRYLYKVSRRYAVKPEATEIEAPSNTPKLTLYTCTLKGAADGRTVIEAILQ